MDRLSEALRGLQAGPRFAAVLVAVVAALYLARWLLEKRLGTGSRFRLPLVMLALTFVGVLVVVTALPIEPALRTELIKLIGILLSASFALASTTFLGNAMAGVLLRVVSGFRMGDYVKVGEHAGRVSERGLFHTEIQTEDRDLTTLPNLYLVSNPVQVVRSSGTILSAEVSLGYDVPRGRIEAALVEACRRSGLQDPFVQVVELGDFSVVYRAAGLLVDVKQILSARSTLRAAMLDELHAAGIEIVSPNFMNTRALDPGARMVPPAERRAPAAEPEASGAPEDVVFDKAEEAEALDALRRRLAELGEEIRAGEKELKGTGEGARAALERRLGTARAELARLEAEVARRAERAAGDS